MWARGAFCYYTNTGRSPAALPAMKKRIQSFKYAGKGVAKVAASEVNFLIHLGAAAAVTALGFYFRLATLEWAAVLLCFGLVLSAEAMNSAVERIVNFISPGHHEKAGEIKDIAAGAVLLAAVVAALTGALIFFPKIAARLGAPTLP